MNVFSPINATFGARVEQFLETEKDYFKYHEKLNKKLQKLRKRCSISTKDTKKYSTKEKYSKLTHEDYDHRSKLFGTLLLLQMERELALCETVNLRSRQRNLKITEKKLLTSRLKKLQQTASKLVDLTQNEQNWITLVQYLAYTKLVYVEYLVYGKHFKLKESDNIATQLAIVFAALKHLHFLKIIPDEVFESLRNRYEYTLMQHAGQILTSFELHNFIANTIESQSDDSVVKLLVNNGFNIELKDIDMENKETVTHVNWRSFNCTITQSHLAQLIDDAKLITVDDVSQYGNKISKWEEALSFQSDYINNHEDDIEDNENEQILLSYIRYQTLLTSASREVFLFKQLWSEWSQLKNSLSIKLLKFKELDRIVSNIRKYLIDIMELPGIYSDDELLFELETVILFFTLNINSGCLANLYQLKGKYMEALTIYTDSYEKLSEKLNSLDNDNLVISSDLLIFSQLQDLLSTIKNNISSVFALASYEKETRDGSHKNIGTVIENIDNAKISISTVQLNNLFPMRPVIKPISAKPTLFDLAFNYIDYTSNSNASEISGISNDENVAEQESTSVPATEEPTQKKRGFLGLFGR